jgi:hypothetical protein
VLEQKLIDQLKSEHGTAVHIRIPETTFDAELDIVVKRVPRGEWKRYRAMLYVDDQRSEALEVLAKACVVYPPAAEFAALLNERPALAEKIGNQLTVLAGGGGEAEAKKL